MKCSNKKSLKLNKRTLKRINRISKTFYHKVKQQNILKNGVSLSFKKNINKFRKFQLSLKNFYLKNIKLNILFKCLILNIQNKLLMK